MISLIRWTIRFNELKVWLSVQEHYFCTLSSYRFLDKRDSRKICCSFVTVKYIFLCTNNISFSIDNTMLNYIWICYQIISVPIAESWSKLKINRYLYEISLFIPRIMIPPLTIKRHILKRPSISQTVLLLWFFVTFTTSIFFGKNE